MNESNDRIRLRLEELRADELRTRFIEDWLVRAVVALDLALRRAATALISGPAPRRRAAARPRGE